MKKFFTLIALVVFLSACGTQEQTPAEENTTPSQDSVAEATYTLEEVATHATPESCWSVMNGKVYDMTSFFGQHPGGDENLSKVCGIDASDVFPHTGMELHETTREAFVIGTLAE